MSDFEQQKLSELQKQQEMHRHELEQLRVLLAQSNAMIANLNVRVRALETPPIDTHDKSYVSAVASSSCDVPNSTNRLFIVASTEVFSPGGTRKAQGASQVISVVLKVSGRPRTVYMRVVSNLRSLQSNSTGEPVSIAEFSDSGKTYKVLLSSATETRKRIGLPKGTIAGKKQRPSHFCHAIVSFDRIQKENIYFLTVLEDNITVPFNVIDVAFPDTINVCYGSDYGGVLEEMMQWLSSVKIPSRKRPITAIDNSTEEKNPLSILVEACLASADRPLS